MKVEVEPYNYNDYGTFVTEWRVKANQSIAIPAQGDYLINWGDGTVEYLMDVITPPTHRYDAEGLYTIKVGHAAVWGRTREVYAPSWKRQGVADQLIDIKQWGKTQWEDMQYLFEGAENLVISATDTPDLSNCYSLDGAFEGCKNLGFHNTIPKLQDKWDVSKVEVGKLLFTNGKRFHGNYKLSHNHKNTYSKAAFLGAVGFDKR